MLASAQKGRGLDIFLFVSRVRVCSTQIKVPSFRVNQTLMFSPNAHGLDNWFSSNSRACPEGGLVLNNGLHQALMSARKSHYGVEFSSFCKNPMSSDLGHGLENYKRRADNTLRTLQSWCECGSLNRSNSKVTSSEDLPIVPVCVSPILLTRFTIRREFQSCQAIPPALLARSVALYNRHHRECSAVVKNKSVLVRRAHVCSKWPRYCDISFCWGEWPSCPSSFVQPLPTRVSRDVTALDPAPPLSLPMSAHAWSKRPRSWESFFDQSSDHLALRLSCTSSPPS